MTINITALFVCLDDFCALYEKTLNARALPHSGQRQRDCCLTLSEMMFIEVLYHFSPFKDFKRFYLYGICQEHRDCFKKLPTYQRFVALKKKLEEVLNELKSLNSFQPSAELLETIKLISKTLYEMKGDKDA